MDPSFIRTVVTVTPAGVGVGVGDGLGDMVTAVRVVAGALDLAGAVAAVALHAVSVPAAATAIHSLRIINSGSPALRLLFGHYV